MLNILVKAALSLQRYAPPNEYLCITLPFCLWIVDLLFKYISNNGARYILFISLTCEITINTWEHEIPLTKVGYPALEDL